MSRVLSHPFRLDPLGHAVTVESGSTTHVAEVIGMLASTRIGERSMCPAFGTPDPVFALDLDIAGRIQAGLDQFGPDGVSVHAGEQTIDPATGTATIDLMFSIEED